MIQKINCWEYINCNQQDCSVFGKIDLLCWLVEGSKICVKDLDSVEVIKHCLQCEVLKNNIQLDITNGFRTLFNQLFKELENSESQLFLFKKISSLIQSTIDLDKILHIILTCVTAGYGLGFNRALLLLIEEDEKRLKGKTMVAPASKEEAYQVWKNLANLDVASDNLAEIIDIYEKRFQIVDTKTNEINQIKISLDEDNIFSSCINQRKALICGSKYKGKIPVDFLKFWQTDYFAVAPLMARNKVLGIIVADNFFNNRPITNEYLELLSSFAYHAGLAIENARLHDKIEKRAEELEIANKRFKEIQGILMKAEKLSAMGEMAATVAHEMRTPLISIGGFAREVRENLKGNDKNSERLDIIIEEVNRLEKIIKDVLDFVKPFELTLTEVNVKKTIRDVLTFFKMGIDRKDIKLNADLNDALPLVKADTERLRQVFINLLENAFDAMPDGGNVDIKTYVAENFINIEVSDTGIGIKDEYLDKVTKPFFTTKQNGIGLGLSIAEKIIKEHKGKLEIIRNEKSGVTFKVTVPI
ncbi:MAG: ATP-binding protein [Candidatus Firestonebacteria bacterium]